MAELTDLKSLDKFSDKLKLIEKKAPGRIIERYDKLGNKIKKELKSATPVSDRKKPQNKRLSTGWTAEKTTKEYGVYVKRIRNKRPHFHLIERGHRVGRRGDVENPKGKDFVEGKFFAEKKLKAMESDIINEQEKMIDDLLGELFDD